MSEDVSQVMTAVHGLLFNFNTLNCRVLFYAETLTDKPATLVNKAQTTQILSCNPDRLDLVLLLSLVGCCAPSKKKKKHQAVHGLSQIEVLIMFFQIKENPI